ATGLLSCQNLSDIPNHRADGPHGYGVVHTGESHHTDLGKWLVSHTIVGRHDGGGTKTIVEVLLNDVHREHRRILHLTQQTDENHVLFQGFQNFPQTGGEVDCGEVGGTCQDDLLLVPLDQALQQDREDRHRKHAVFGRHLCGKVVDHLGD